MTEKLSEQRPQGRATDEPPLQKIAEEFYMFLGMCIAQWAYVEDEIFQIFWKSLGCSKTRAAIAFYNNPSFESRLRLTDELVKEILPKRERVSGGHNHDDLRLWNDLLRMEIDLRPVRNQIAHDPVGPRFGLASTGRQHHTSWFEIGVRETEMLAGRASKKSPISVRDLTDHLTKVSQLAGSLHRFLFETLTKHA